MLPVFFKENPTPELKILEVVRDCSHPNQTLMLVVFSRHFSSLINLASKSARILNHRENDIMICVLIVRLIWHPQFSGSRVSVPSVVSRVAFTLFFEE